MFDLEIVKETNVNYFESTNVNNVPGKIYAVS
jgi:hypothetical protein